MPLLGCPSVVPNNNLGLYLSPHERRAVTRWWIGVDLNTKDCECPFCQDKSGNHASVCNMNGNRISGHSMSSQAALFLQLEKQYIFPGTQMKPADHCIPTWSAGKPLAMDVSVVSPTNHIYYCATTNRLKCYVQFTGERSRRT